MAQIDTTRTWIPGDSVDAAKMNEIIDDAFAEPDLIHGQTNLPAVAVVPADDEVLIWDADVAALRRVKVQALPSGTTSVGMTATPTTVFGVSVTDPTGDVDIALSLDNQQALTGTNKLNKILACPADGVSGQPLFRAMVPKDTASFTDIAANDIDCTLDNVFRKQLSATLTLKLNDGVRGQRLTIYLIQNNSPYNFQVLWDTDDVGGVIRWPGGTRHTMSSGSAGVTDIVNFLCMGSGLYYGTFDKNFLPYTP